MPFKAREAALKILNDFEKSLKSPKGRRLTSIKGDEFVTRVEERDRALYTMLIKGILRKKEKIDSVIREFSNRKTGRIETDVLNCLRIGVFEIIYLSKIPEYATLNETVNLAGRKKAASKPFVNAVLRTILRERNKIPLIPDIKTTLDCLTYSLSYPRWMAEMLLERYGKEKAIRYAESLNEEEPLTIRINTLKVSQGPLLSVLEDSGATISKSDFIDNCYIVRSKIAIESFKPFQDGLFYVQNTSSQIAAKILGPSKGELILDACSAPGGKSAHIQALTSNESFLYAVDLSDEKLKIVKENFQRLGVKNFELVSGNASRDIPSLKEKAGAFDRILLDAPCSALGAIRKNPEIKWLRSAQDIQRLSKFQSALLGKQKDYLKTGGTMVYSVCTFTKEETVDIIGDFLRKNKSFRIDPVRADEVPKLADFLTEEGFLLIPPVNNELEPFFISRLIKGRRNL